MYLIWITVVVEWRNPSGSVWVVLVSGDGYHPSFQSDIVDCFWMDSSLVFGPTVQPHAVAPELERLDAALEENLQEDRKSTRLNSSHVRKSRMPSSA